MPRESNDGGVGLEQSATVPSPFLVMLQRGAAGFVAISTIFTATCVFFAAANLLAWPFVGGEDSAEGKEFADYRHEALALAYPDLSESERTDLMNEFSMGFVRDVQAQVREAPLAGRFVNVSPPGYRLGLDQAVWPPDRKAYNIFFFGGSTAFGYGVADEDTIPSRLQAALAGAGDRPVHVYNVARGGYYSTQERIQFDKQATFGPRPDLAIFLDGLNDNNFTREPPFSTFSTTVKTEQELSSGAWAVLRLLPLFQLFEKTTNVGTVQQWGAGLVRDGTRIVNEPAKLVARRYRANVEAIAAIGRVYGIRTAFFWQPVPEPFDSYNLVKAMASRNELGENFHWCAHVGQGRKRKENYVDRVHYSPTISEGIAQCIAAGLRAGELLK